MNNEELISRLEKCHDMIGKMCKELRHPKMSIPANRDDEDIYICDTISMIIELLRK